MIRWLFVLLLLANGFYALWHWQQAPADNRKAQPEVASAVPTLVMISEVAEPLRLAEAASKPETYEPEVETVPVSCWYVGGFDEKVGADRAVQALQALQLTVSLETTSVPDEPDYWVHVGPFSTRDKAMSVLQQLRARKVDSFLIDDGELKNAISLGFFSQKRSATGLQARYRELDYPVRIHEVARFRPRYELYAGGRVTAPDLAAAMADAGLTVEPAKTAKKSCI